MVVRLEGNSVAEIIPEYALPVEKWYGEEFATRCVEASEEVECGWVYDREANAFSPPGSPEPTPHDQIAELQEANKLKDAQIQAMTDRSDFVEECLAEMAMLLYQ